MSEKIKYIILATFLGIICKIYDDVADNMLYNNFNIPDDKKCYFDDILKGLFIIGFSIVSLKNPFFLISFTVLNALLYFNCKQDFTSYEFSSFVSPIILIPFLDWNNVNNHYINIFYLLLMITMYAVSEKMSNKQENKEYSNKKMFTRLILLVILTCVIFYRSSLYITNGLLQLLYFGAGYLFIVVLHSIVY